MSEHGRSWCGRRGAGVLVWQGAARHGSAWSGRLGWAGLTPIGEAGCGMARYVSARFGWAVAVCLVVVWPGSVRSGSAG
jgi:hypothetical protein